MESIRVSDVLQSVEDNEITSCSAPPAMSLLPAHQSGFHRGVREGFGAKEYRPTTEYFDDRN